MTPSAAVPVLALGLLAFVACGEPTDPLGSVDVPRWEVGAEPVSSIGVVDGPPEYTLAEVRAVRLLPEGRIAVADGSSNTVRLYSSAGAFEGQLGGPGEGPGEFTALSRMLFVPPDTIVAYQGLDGARSASFLPTGELTSTTTFRVENGYPELYLGPTGDGSHVIAWIAQAPRDRNRVTPDVMELGRFAPTGELAERLATTAGMRRMGSPTPLSPHFVAGMIGDTVLYADGLHGAIHRVTAAGGDLAPIDAPLQRLDVDDARERQLAALDSAQLAFLTRTFEDGWPTDTVPVMSELLVGSEFLIWVKAYHPATDSHWAGRRLTGGEWLVLRSDGTPVARATMPDGFRLMDVRGDRIVGVRRDELGVERVEVYALEGRGGG